MDKTDTRDLMVLNKSKRTIYAIISKNDNMNSSSFYDEFEHDENYVYTREDSINRFIFEKIEPNTKYASHDRPQNWDVFFRSINDKKMRLFIVAKDSVDKYGWNKIFKKNIYNEKYYLSIKELDNMKWEIEYNGE
jgi:hypothetical protein